MGISFKVAHWLNENGHDAIHLSHQGLHALSDFQIVEKSIEEKRVILTSDMDFGQLLMFHDIHSLSVIQFRISDLSPSNIIEKLTIIFEKFDEQLNSNQPTPVLITVQEKKIRLKNLAI